MAEILAFLDFRQFVHGDVSSATVLWSLAPQPLVYLVGCDRLVPHLPSVGGPARTQAGDRYALALAIYRYLLLRPD